MIFSPLRPPIAVKLTVVIALTGAILATPGRAASSDEEAACAPDAFRLCSSEIPDVNRITACMERQKASLSPACRVFFQTSEPTGNRSASKALKPGSLTPIKSKKANS